MARIVNVTQPMLRCLSLSLARTCVLYVYILIYIYFFFISLSFCCKRQREVAKKRLSGLDVHFYTSLCSTLPRQTSLLALLAQSSSSQFPYLPTHSQLLLREDPLLSIHLTFKTRTYTHTHERLLCVDHLHTF